MDRSSSNRIFISYAWKDDPPFTSAKVVRGVGHFVMLEAPAVFNELLKSIIEEFQRQSPAR